MRRIPLLQIVCHTERNRKGFTVTELLVAMAVFVLVMVALFSALNQSSMVWQRTQTDVDAYQSARFAFNLMTRTLSQSRMNVYDDYNDPAQPTAYLRKSDLHFIIDDPQGASFGQGNSIFFQAPLGRTLDESNYGDLPGMLDSIGYYVTYGKNPSLPDFLKPKDRNRFRLMQFHAPAEKMTVYTVPGKAWYQNYLNNYSTVIADNIVLLLCWPRLAVAEDPEGDDLTKEFSRKYRYDSRDRATDLNQPVTANQQPPLVQVTLVAIDQALADRLKDSVTPPTEITSHLTGLFGTASADQFKIDLEKLETRFSGGKIGYRLFDTTVTLRETKWRK